MIRLTKRVVKNPFATGWWWWWGLGEKAAEVKNEAAEQPYATGASGGGHGC